MRNPAPDGREKCNQGSQAFVAVVIIALGAAGEVQQLAKSGKYTGKYAALLVGGFGQSYELEKGHVFFLGMNHGVFLNDVADSFLDKTEVTCPIASDIVDGVSTGNHGYCIITDKDGDKAFLVWQGKGHRTWIRCGHFPVDRWYREVRWHSGKQYLAPHRYWQDDSLLSCVGG
jgi:hypothetical protein